MALFPLGILSAAGAVGPAIIPDYELIESQILTGTEASVTFSNLNTYSSSFKHLQIRAVARTAGSYSDIAFIVRLNGDTGSNYSVHYLVGNGSSVSSVGAASNTSMNFYGIAGNSQASGVFGAGIIDILDYSSTTKNKTLRAITGTGATKISLGSGAYFNTAAITSVNIAAEGTGSWLAGSRFSIYGIKG
jgi:hypothetical protein